MGRATCISIVATFVALSAGFAAGAHAETCRQLLPASKAATAEGRHLTAKDLIELRDIGDYGPQPAATDMLSVSPDGRSVAFQLRQASVEANRYCLGIIVLDLASGRPLIVDQGGEFIPWTGSVHGFAEYTTPGMPKTIVPRWSPDGRSVAYLRRDQGVTQVWTAEANGTGARAITHATSDITAFAWTGPQSLVYASRPALDEAREAIVAEGRSGLHYDDRWAPVLSNWPFPREPMPTDVQLLDLRSGLSSKASDEALRVLASVTGKPSTGPGRLAVATRNGVEVWTTAKAPERLKSPTILHVRWPGSRERICDELKCQYIVAVWIAPDGEALWLQAKEGWAESQSVFYVWHKARSGPEETLRTDDVIAGCEPANDGLICTRESALIPRHIVELKVAEGTVTTTFDPNPEIRGLLSDRVERLHWKNSYGIETIGDLVLPRDYMAGSKLPLIVVQYQTRGFLRGGTGNEYPIQLFADRGYAVLSFEKPLPLSLQSGATNWDEAGRIDRVNWADRKSVQSSLETGIDLLAARGLIDEGRLGLTGLSDGSSTVQYWLIHGRPIAAAAISTCCADPSVTGFLDGPVVGRTFAAMGYPALTKPDDAVWSQVSIRMNAAKIDTPLLMQIPDHEYLGALEAYTALKESGKMVEMYVFPDEYHIKIQPVHRLAIYQRSIDWFDHWLRAPVSPSP